MSDSSGGLNGSTQHELAVYLQESQKLKWFGSVDSNENATLFSSDWVQLD